MTSVLPRYAELHAVSNFSFLKGASHPEELVLRAVELGYAALAITDECSLAGVVRAHAEAKNTGLHLIIGSTFVLDDGLRLVVLATSLHGYGNLSELITLGRMRCAKGEYRVTRADLDGRPQSRDDIPASAGTIDHLAGLPECIVLWIPGRDASEADLEVDARWVASTFPDRTPPDRHDPAFVAQRAWIGVQRTHRMDDRLTMDRLVRLGERIGLRCVATGDVQMHVRSRKPLQDTMTAIRLGRPVADCGEALAPNAERHLRSRIRLGNLFDLRLVEETVRIADQCRFNLVELRYFYPKEIVPEGQTQTSWLRKLTADGLATRFPPAVIARLPAGRMDHVHRQVEHELALIAELGYEAFFLTVYDIVRHARSVDILCQGRGSAANSAVCYCLGITEVNPALQDMLFERFLTKERNEPPDIDVDFEHQRREEVIQYIYDKYGRHRTALAATVIAYRTRSAIRDVGKALGLDGERVDRLSASHAWWDGSAEHRERLEENGFDPDSPVVQKLIQLTGELRSFPRHLSQHVGGFVISNEKLSRMVPIENAAMQKPSDWDEAVGARAIYRQESHGAEDREGASIERAAGSSEEDGMGEDASAGDEAGDEAGDDVDVDEGGVTQRRGSPLFPTFRSVIQWDKDDLEELGLLKVDVLALGMLSAVRRALDLVGQRRGYGPDRPFRMIDVPQEDPAVYDMICEADTVGVFQIESRAQMSMLPRLRPRTYYDLVVEVAIVRPGPIVGGMVHPYLKAREAQRSGLEITYPAPAVKEALARTLGVPIFQEQVMQLMMLAADFSAGEADKLRRAMAAWKRKGGLGPFQDRIVNGMIQNGYEREYAERIFKQVEGFGEYGFPESHAASFAFLVYISCWIKHHEPAAFLAAMLNSQPLGFYSPSQLIQDAKRHDVEVLPIDVTISEWDAVLEEREEIDAPSRKTSKALTGRREAHGMHETGETFGVQSFLHDDNAKGPKPAVRLGFNSIKSFNLKAAIRVLRARAHRQFDSVEDLGRRAALSMIELDALAAADVLKTLVGARRAARWESAAHRLQPDLMRKALIKDATPHLPMSTEGRSIVDDYASMGFTLRRHPLALLRPRLRAMSLLSAAELHELADGSLVSTTGIVTVRQRPGTAKGTIFVSLEDETGTINVIVWSRLIRMQRQALLSAKLLTVFGTWQCKNNVTSVLARYLIDSSYLAQSVKLPSRDFH